MIAVVQGKTWTFSDYAAGVYPSVSATGDNVAAQVEPSDLSIAVPWLFHLFRFHSSPLVGVQRSKVSAIHFTPKQYELDHADFEGRIKSHVRQRPTFERDVRKRLMFPLPFR
jgi:hypothetical protein